MLRKNKQTDTHAYKYVEEIWWEREQYYTCCNILFTHEYQRESELKITLCVLQYQKKRKKIIKKNCSNVVGGFIFMVYDRWGVEICMVWLYVCTYV